METNQRRPTQEKPYVISGDRYAEVFPHSRPHTLSFCPRPTKYTRLPRFHASSPPGGPVVMSTPATHPAQLNKKQRSPIVS
jgi:hypothetical protein